MDVQLFSIQQTAAQITQAYTPVNLAQVDECAIRLVKFQGEFERWHAHEHEDESFIVLQGEILFQTEVGDFLLKAGEGLVIPKGLRHCPKAQAEGEMPLALIIERSETKRLGD
ncbi:MAG: cupin domain-containing protein [Acidobacteria bacterium]|nr:cupin domain-containing protein [Acidobacteriota bacterium]MBI3426242.1 cupin domain-containing protein [Acidobacteriota bacterium]